MAENFLYNIAEKVLVKIGTLALDEASLIWNCRDEIMKIKDKLSVIQAVLLDADEKQRKDKQLKKWLKKLKSVCYDISDVLDEVEYEELLKKFIKDERFRDKVRHFILNNPVFFRRYVGHRLEDIRAELDNIAEEKSQFQLLERQESRRVNLRSRETHSYVKDSDVIGRDNDKQYLIDTLMKSFTAKNVEILPIVGIGGLGKTTLARYLYNDGAMDSHFELKIWISVMQDFDVKQIGRQILTHATGKNFHQDLSMEEMQKYLRPSLGNKKFLIVLDDVWNEDRVKWKRLEDFLQVGAKGSRIVVTTRSSSVATIMGTAATFYLKGLPHHDCVTLFKRWAFEQGNDYPNLMKTGEEIVKKCKGVPLAVRTLGSLLYKNIAERDWLDIKNNEIWKLNQDDVWKTKQSEEDIMPALRLSYDELPYYLKQCFAHCSIFPKGYQFTDLQLVQVWIAQGLISSSDQSRELEEIGNEYIKKLCSRSLFQDVEEVGPFTTFKMHDLIHDVALTVAQTECSTITMSNCDQAIPKTVRHVFLSSTELLEKRVPKTLLELNNTRTIFLPMKVSEANSKNFVDKCLGQFSRLRVLDLGDSGIEVLHKSIGDLKHLRYLNLSGNHGMKRLPKSICKLLNLQTLLLGRCRELEELPEDIDNLTRLRVLTLSTKQSDFPENFMRNFSSLQFLGIGECPNLRSLGKDTGCLTSLRTLYIGECKSLERLPHELVFSTKLENLAIVGCEKIDLKGWEDDPDKILIKAMYIEKLPQLVDMPKWIRNAANSLEILSVEDCPELRAMPEWIKELHALRELKIEECPELTERCCKDNGEDWPNVAHIKKLCIDGNVYD